MHISEVAQIAHRSYFYETYTTEDDLNSFFCALSLKADRKIVAFRGTDQLLDWIFVNLKTELEPHPCLDCYDGASRAHAGFIDVYEQLIDALEEIVKDVDDLVFTGHSMGGVIASICASSILQAYPDKKCKLVTFGSPMYGNKYFVKGVSDAVGLENMIRVVNWFDLVPLLPPFWFPGYTHCKSRVVRIKELKPLHKIHSMETYVKGSLKLDISV